MKMASSVPFVLLSIFLLFTLSNAQQSSFRPRALLLPVQKDAATLQYLTKVNQRTPSVSLNLVLDLGGRFLWVDCQNNFVSSTYRTVRCGTAPCSLSGTHDCGECSFTPSPTCSNNSCTIYPENTVTISVTGGVVTQDVLTLASTDGSNPGQSVTVSQFIFSCTRTFLLEGLASGAVGMAGLGRSRIALPSQLASAFSFQRKFALCLSGSTSAPGVVFFGDGPYNLLPNVEASSLLKFTPLFITPARFFNRAERSEEYFIGIKSITIDDEIVPLNTTLLSFDSQGIGGTKISTVNPYTVLETSIFKAVTEVFTRKAAARNISRVAGVAPFEVCFSSQNVGSTRLGAAVPFINLVLQTQSVVWTITGSNSMVYVNDNVLCLGFVDGGSNPSNSIVIGGYQLENLFLQFDLATTRLGFSSSLLGFRTTCSNFNFTSTP